MAGVVLVDVFETVVKSFDEVLAFVYVFVQEFVVDVYLVGAWLVLVATNNQRVASARSLNAIATIKLSIPLNYLLRFISTPLFEAFLFNLILSIDNVRFC